MKIYIVGVGPGNPMYMLPAAAEALKRSDVIIAGKRNLETIDTSGKKTIELSGNYNEVIEYIKNNHESKTIAVAASGDPGFYGILRYMKKHFKENDLEVIPGLSSMQYMFSRVKMSWDDAIFVSMHGKDEDPVPIVKEHGKSVFLTDNKRTYKHIAAILCEAGFGSLAMYVGSNLSYDDEKIVKGTVAEMAEMEEDFNLCVVVILNEK